MSDIIKALQALQNTPVPNLLVVAGFIFLFMAFVGKFGAFIELPKERQKWAGFIGSLLLIFGVSLFMLPGTQPNSVPVPSTNTPLLPTSTDIPPSPTVSPTDTPTMKELPVPSTNTPLLPTPTDIPPSPTVSPTDTPTMEELQVLFSNGPLAITTQHSYSGRIQITVSGTGKAADQQSSDAFYVFTDKYDKPTTPRHYTERYNWGLCINGENAERFIVGSQIPAYQEDHIYTFEIEAPGGQLTFGIGDIGTSDNHGSYSVRIQVP